METIKKSAQKKVNVEPDNILVEKYQHGDSKALGILVQRHQKWLIPVITSWVHDRDTAWDIFQFTCFKVSTTLKIPGAYKETQNFRAWITIIAKNHMINIYRRNRRIIDYLIQDTKKIRNIFSS